MCHEQQSWLAQAERTVAEEHEARRFWPGVLRRWTLALIFALASAWAAGRGYALATKPYAEDLETLRARMDFVESVEHRIVTMTPGERRQFDSLMKWNATAETVSV